MPRKSGKGPAKRAEREVKRELRQSERENRRATSGASKPANKRAARKPAPAQAAAPAPAPAPAPQYNIQASPGNPNPTAQRPGRYDVAGKYMGASSPVQLPGGGGMSAKMAAARQQNPSQYPTHANPAGGTPKYTYNY